MNLGFEARVYFRYSDVGVLNEIQFIEIDESFRSRDYAYLTGRVRLSELLRLQRAGKWKDVFFALLPEEKRREPEGESGSRRGGIGLIFRVIV